ncbi:MAG: 50S ribosomal protein L35 [Actinobacteria bacterium]|nr:50S ribosomal protein L35 [Actinomycetota bacterium]
MPKMKTHSGTKKRFKVTGSGKLMHERTNRRHLLEVKSSRRTRRLSLDAQVKAVDVPKIKRLLGMR